MDFTQRPTSFSSCKVNFMVTLDECMVLNKTNKCINEEKKFYWTRTMVYIVPLGDTHYILRGPPTSRNCARREKKLKF